MSFKIDDVVIYQTLGVCRIVDIRTEEFPMQEPREYYILELVFGTNTCIYAPVDNEKVLMRKVLSKKKVEELIAAMPACEPLWTDNENERKELYRGIIKGGDRTLLSRVIKTLYNKKAERAAVGKKFHACDERFMGEAEKLLFEELAYVLGIPVAEVVPYISQIIEQ